MDFIRTTAILGLVSVFLNQDADAKSVSFAVDDYCPYYCKDPDPSQETFLALPGYIIEILNYAYSQKGYQIDYHFAPWERGLTEIYKNTINGIVVTSKSDAPELIFPKNEQGISIGCFVTNTTNSWRYTSRESLNHVRLGVIQGYEYSQPIDSYIWQYHETEDRVTHLSGANALTRLLIMISKNRIDAVIDDKTVLKHSISALNLEDSISFAGCNDDNRIKLYVGFSPNNPNSPLYAKILSNAMIELRKSGQLATILAKYHITDWH